MLTQLERQPHKNNWRQPKKKGRRPQKKGKKEDDLKKMKMEDDVNFGLKN